MWVLLDVDASRGGQAQLRAGVLDGLGDEDVAPADLRGSRVDGVSARISRASRRRGVASSRVLFRRNSPLTALGTLKRAMSTTLSKSSPMQPATQRSISTATSRRSSNRSLRSTIASLPAGRSPGEETRSSGSLRDSLEAQRTWANRLNSSTDSSGAIAPGSGAIARPRSNLEPRLPHPSSP